MSISSWKDELWYIRAWIGKEQITDISHYMDGFQRHHTVWKKPVSKDYIVYDSLYVAFVKNYRVREQISGYQQLMEGGCNYTGGVLGGDGTILYLDYGGYSTNLNICLNSKNCTQHNEMHYESLYTYQDGLKAKDRQHEVLRRMCSYWISHRLLVGYTFLYWNII